MFRRVGKDVTSEQIAEFIKCEHHGAAITINDYSALSSPLDHTLMFLSETINTSFGLKEDRTKEVELLQNMKGIVLLTDMELSLEGSTVIKTSNPRLAFQSCLTHFFTEKLPYKVCESAKIDDTATLGSGLNIGSFVTIGPGVTIGDGTYIGDNVSILGDVTIGENCVIKSGARIGSEGFSFTESDNGLEHIPHVGRVVIGKDVWLGCNSCVERGTIDNTIIEDGVKVDDLVQIGHNSFIGEFSQIAAGAIVSGRVHLEPWCWVAPNCVIENAVRIGQRSLIGSSSLVRKNVEEYSVMAGVPAKLIRKLEQS
jgi:UDP-3-O-[3-hydroxymyristoyl] glucosamine N-acyltransferase